MKLFTKGKCGKLGCYGRTAEQFDFKEYTLRNSSSREFVKNYSKLHDELYKAGYSSATHCSSWANGDSEDDDPIWTEFYIYPRRRDIFNDDATGEQTCNWDSRVCTVRAYYAIDPKLDRFFRNFSPSKDGK
jgi:hypothetical protein